VRERRAAANPSEAGGGGIALSGVGAGKTQQHCPVIRSISLKLFERSSRQIGCRSLTIFGLIDQADATFDKPLFGAGKPRPAKYFRNTVCH
jgi:hypothetical protein